MPTSLRRSVLVLALLSTAAPVLAAPFSPVGPVRREKRRERREERREERHEKHEERREERREEKHEAPH